jgi:hypothetical protein
VSPFGRVLTMAAAGLFLSAVISANTNDTDVGAWFERGVCVVGAVAMLVAVYLKEGDTFEQHYLIVQHADEVMVGPPDLYGPFPTLHQAQVFARDFRKRRGIPGASNSVPSAAENDAWTDAGWYFAITNALGKELPHACAP